MKVKRWLGCFGASWGVLGVCTILLHGVVRLWPHAIEPLRTRSLSLTLVAAYAVCIGALVYAEGYRGFHKSLAPKFARRARDIAECPTLDRVILAPAVCLGLYRVPRRELVASWVLLVVIVGFIATVRHLPPIWRGAVDAGVVAGLSMGTAALIYAVIRGDVARQAESRGGANDATRPSLTSTVTLQGW